MKLLKLEVDVLPKDQRKEALKRRREEKEIEQTERVSHVTLKDALNRHSCKTTSVVSVS